MICDGQLRPTTVQPPSIVGQFAPAAEQIGRVRPPQGENAVWPPAAPPPAARAANTAGPSTGPPGCPPQNGPLPTGQGGATVLSGHGGATVWIGHSGPKCVQPGTSSDGWHCGPRCVH